MNIRSVTTVLLLIAATSTTQAASVKLEPSAGTVVQNSVFTVKLELEAGDALGEHPGNFGGEVVVDFDNTLLSYGGFTLAGGLSYFVSPVLVTNGNTQTVRFGFENAPDIGTVGTFAFTAIGNPGSLAQIGLKDADDFSGTFINADDTDHRFRPIFVDTEVSISAVPLPAGVWLLGTAIAALATRQAARRRLRRAAA